MLIFPSSFYTGVLTQTFFHFFPGICVPIQTIRKQLTYQTQQVSGPGWVTIGDGIGFTNPLHSPGITASMASSTFAAELTRKALAAKDEAERREVWKAYDEWCAAAIPALNQMNKVRSRFHDSSCSFTHLIPPSINLVQLRLLQEGSLRPSGLLDVAVLRWYRHSRLAAHSSSIPPQLGHLDGPQHELGLGLSGT